MDSMLIRYGVEAGCVDHATRNAASEFLYLFANTEEEGIGAPATNEHDSINRDTIEVHGHSSCGPVGVIPMSEAGKPRVDSQKSLRRPEAVNQAAVVLL